MTPASTLQTHTTTTPATGSAEMTPRGTLRVEIRDATRAEHEDLERHMDLMRPDFALDDYAMLLGKYHRFYASFEQFLQSRADHGSIFASFYCRDRSKAAWLASDLNALHVDGAAPANRLPQPRLAALFASEQRLLGALYVVEGSMLGGSVLSKRFRKCFDLTPQTGLRFFSGYGADTREKWLALLELLEQFDHDPYARQQVIDGARSMFLLFKEQVAAA